MDPSHRNPVSVRVIRFIRCFSCEDYNGYWESGMILVFGAVSNQAYIYMETVTIIRLIGAVSSIETVRTLIRIRARELNN